MGGAELEQKQTNPIALLVVGVGILGGAFVLFSFARFEQCTRACASNYTACTQRVADGTAPGLDPKQLPVGISLDEAKQRETDRCATVTKTCNASCRSLSLAGRAPAQ